MADRLPSKTNEEVSDTLKGGLELKTLFHFFYLSKIPIARVRWECENQRRRHNCPLQGDFMSKKFWFPGKKQHLWIFSVFVYLGPNKRPDYKESSVDAGGLRSTAHSGDFLSCTYFTNKKA